MGKENRSIKTRALCDNGSQVNLITNAIVQQLQETPTLEPTSFTGIGGKSVGSATGEVSLGIKLKDGGCMVSKFFVVKNITNYRSSTTNRKWKHLGDQLADEDYDKPGKVQVLLGVSSWIGIIKPGILRTNDGSSIAHETKLGYVILENSADPYAVEQPYIRAITKGPSIKKLLEVMQKLWQIEEVPQKTKRTVEEDRCEEIFVNCHTREKHGRYVLRMPFNKLIPKLGKSKRSALHQFFAMENKMRGNAEFAEEYKLFMAEYETLGHMEQI